MNSTGGSSRPSRLARKRVAGNSLGTIWRRTLLREFVIVTVEMETAFVLGVSLRRDEKVAYIGIDRGGRENFLDPPLAVYSLHCPFRWIFI